MGTTLTSVPCQSLGRNSGTIGTGETMTVAVNAIYENGVLKPEGPLALKEQAKVRVIIQSDEEELPAAGDDDPTGWKVARELIGCISDAPEDVAEHHDKYLYGRELYSSIRGSSSHSSLASGRPWRSMRTSPTASWRFPGRCLVQADSGVPAAST